MKAADDRGAATVLGVAVTGLLLVVGVALVEAVGLFADHRRAQAAADLGALAGAAQVAEGSPCAEAAAVVEANGADLVSCTVTGRVVDVEASVAGPGWWGPDVDLVGRARAGPGAYGTPGTYEGPGAAGAAASSTSSSSTAPALLSGLFWLPHLGDWMHEGQPSRHSQEAMVSRVARSQAAAAR